MSDVAVAKLGWGKTVLYSLAPLVCLLALLEMSARIAELFWPPMTVEAGLTFTPESRVFEPLETADGWMVTNPAKSGVPEQVSAMLPSDIPVSSAMLFRHQWFQKQKPSGACRIAVVGESSIFNAQKQLQIMAKRLWFRFPDFTQVDVLNCGGNGYGSDRLLILVRELMEYEPDLVLLYIGNNEFNELRQVVHANMNLLPIQRMLWKSAALRFVRDRMALYSLEQKVEEYNRALLGEPLKGRPQVTSEIPADEIDERMENFYSNLSLMVDVCRQNGVGVLMGTVPSNLRNPKLAPPDSERFAQKIEPRYVAEDFAGASEATREMLKQTLRSQSSDTENATIRRVAKERGVQLVDMEAVIISMEPHGIPGMSLFQDHCHLGTYGNDALAQTFENAIAEHLQNLDYTEGPRVPPQLMPQYD